MGEGHLDAMVEAAALAGDEELGVLERQEVVDEEGRADVGTPLQPLEALVVLELVLRDVEIDRALGDLHVGLGDPEQGTPHLGLVGADEGREHRAEPADGMRPRRLGTAVDQRLAQRAERRLVVGQGAGRDRALQEPHHSSGMAAAEHRRIAAAVTDQEVLVGLGEMTGVGQIDVGEPVGHRAADTRDQIGSIEEDRTGHFTFARQPRTGSVYTSV